MGKITLQITKILVVIFSYIQCSVSTRLYNLDTTKTDLPAILLAVLVPDKFFV